jgi:NADP-dependent 3-hydroxy acid dehydrogenase YdfG
VGELTGRRILVTGASSGIGAATGRALAAAGAQVALLARRHEPLAHLAHEIGGVAVPADVTDVLACRTAIDGAAEQLGGLDGVVNAAGVVFPGSVADADPDGWRAMVEVNLLGVLHVTQACIPHLRASGRGDVVNVSSMSGRRVASAETGVYAATKAGLHALSEGLRRELTPDRIRVGVIAPGFVATPLYDDRTDAASAALRERAAREGLDVAAVADAIVRMVAAPPEVLHVEVALLSLDQG